MARTCSLTRTDGSVACSSMLSPEGLLTPHEVSAPGRESAFLASRKYWRTAARLACGATRDSGGLTAT